MSEISNTQPPWEIGIILLVMGSYIFDVVQAHPQYPIYIALVITAIGATYLFYKLQNPVKDHFQQKDPEIDSIAFGKSKPLFPKKGLNLKSYAVKKRIYESHQLTLGTTGAGKTYSVLRPQIRSEIKFGNTIFIIDPKGDSTLRDAVYSYAKEFERSDDFIYFSLTNPENSNRFNPFSGSGISEIKDLIISSTVWSEPYYKKMSEASLLKCLKEIKGEIDLDSIIRSLPDKKELTGLKCDLEIMKMSSFGPLISRSDSPTLKDFYNEKKVVYFSLDVQAFPEAAIQIGKIILSGLMGLSNHASTSLDQKDRKRVNIVVDEFGSFITDPFINFLNKARSSNIRFLLATQSISDLKSLDPVHLGRIIDNTPVKIIMLLSDPESIEYTAKIFGTKEAVKDTSQTQKGLFFSKRDTGMGSSRDVEEFIVHPGRIRALNQGEGFLITQAPYTISKVKFSGTKDNSTPYKPIKRSKPEIKDTKIAAINGSDLLEL
ncbi:MAG: type IV secretion system DNA-binding domain-containing protein [Bacteriovoracaceae bacterium]|jgi:hypothetical protein|nr:type IV secretion system DNA-binding domain-containing protein [Bacteriovoracaceae bacterium]